MMQFFAGLPLASELDLAVTAFRDQGHWQANLQHLPGNPGSNNVVPGVCAEPLAIDDPCAEAPAADVNPAVNAPTFPTHLHQHPCHRRVSAACGTRRRCRVCNVRIAHRTVYFHCAHNCRFTVCADCFRPSSRAQTHDACTRRCASEPPHLACVDADPSATRTSCVYGRVQLTRYLDMSIEDFVHRVNGLISAGRFADLGVPQVRIEGTTAWGALPFVTGPYCDINPLYLANTSCTYSCSGCSERCLSWVDLEVNCCWSVPILYIKKLPLFSSFCCWCQ